jgi:hypothetical protein
MIVVVTTTLDPGLQRWARASGAHALPLQPIALPALAAILRTVSRPGASIPESQPASTRGRLLAVADDAGFRELAEQLVRGYGSTSLRRRTASVGSGSWRRSHPMSSC